MQNLLEIKALKVSSGEKSILKGVSLNIVKGSTHALMGENGSGKSTLAQTLMGNPVYKVVQGTVLLDGQDLFELDPTQRSQAGIFLSFQHPVEVTGVNTAQYLRLIYNKKTGQNVSPANFRKFIKEKLEILNFSEDFLTRYLNDGFSGGEKKRMEMLQMLVLEPKLAILDEIDSGLDIDALKTVSAAVNYLKQKTDMTVILITHYARILKYINADFVHILKAGELVKSGGAELAQTLEDKGFADTLFEGAEDPK